MKTLEECTCDELISIIRLLQTQIAVLQERNTELQEQTTELQKQNAELQKQNAELQKRVTELEKKLNKDSHNSSKPPSSDGFKKPLKTKSERMKTGRSTGGQPGHKGHMLSLSETPDQVVIHELKECFRCGNPLERVPVEGYKRRQVWDIPPIRLQVTEHRAEMKSCSCCHQKQQAIFPTEIAYSVQYGENLESMVMYWNHYQLIPFDRTVEMVRDLFKHTMSEGTIANMTKRLFKKLEPVEANIKQKLLLADVLHMDETGIRVHGRTEWLHVYSTDSYTYYTVHPKRGTEAMDAIGILPLFKGTAVHDALRSYFTYTHCAHALCNAHLLRELTFLFEQEKQTWAKDLHTLLLIMKIAVDTSVDQGIPLNQEEIAALERFYDRIVRKGCHQNPHAIKTEKKRGRIKQSTARNLLDRLLLHRASVLAFLHDPQIPFDNNQAERDVRMTKVKQKISGTFRSLEGISAFCRIRGWISTTKKQGKSVLESIQQVLHGEPILTT